MERINKLNNLYFCRRLESRADANPSTSLAPNNADMSHSHHLKA